MPSNRHGFIPSSDEGMLRRRVKSEIRKRMGALRNTLPASSCAQRSARIVERLIDLEPLASARTVASFWPIEHKHEVDLRALDGRLRERGVRVAYPVVEGNTAELSFRFVADVDAMQEHPFGYREPSSQDPEALPGDIDVIVVPALAIDPRGHRIGYGAGHYDRALPRFAPPAVTVSVAYDFQLVAETPETEGDVATLWIVTDARAIAAST
jgi:5-formyltetrahydrofolate cyclo-ligase